MGLCAEEDESRRKDAAARGAVGSAKRLGDSRKLISMAQIETRLLVLQTGSPPPKSYVPQ